MDCGTEQISTRSFESKLTLSCLILKISIGCSFSLRVLKDLTPILQSFYIFLQKKDLCFDYFGLYIVHLGFRKQQLFSENIHKYS